MYDAIINDTLQVPTSNLQFPTSNFQPVTRHPSPTPLLPFTGREAELQALRTASADHKLILHEGEPGIGKTRLAEEYIYSTNAIALRSAAHELEQALPYQPFIESLRGLLSRSDWPEMRAAWGI